MKNSIQIGLYIFLLLSISCKKKLKQAAYDEENQIEIVSDNVDTSVEKREKVKDCDDFLEQYEEWMNDYVEFLAEYKDNPVGMISDSRYSNTLSNATVWVTDWSVIATSCAVNEDYEKRFKEISNKTEERMEELGFK